MSAADNFWQMGQKMVEIGQKSCAGIKENAPKPAGTAIAVEKMRHQANGLQTSPTGELT
jgi:hypothetical protein